MVRFMASAKPLARWNFLTPPHSPFIDWDASRITAKFSTFWT